MQNESQKDQTLSKLLRSTKQHSSLPPRFQESVWNRILCAEAQPKTTAWHILQAWLENTFRRPAFAFAYVAVLLVAGIGAGLWHAEDRQTQAQSEWRIRYVQAVDPYQMPRN